MQGQKLRPRLAVCSRKTKLILKPGPDWCLKEEEEEEEEGGEEEEEEEERRAGGF